MTELIRIVWELLCIPGMFILSGVALVTVVAFALVRVNSSLDRRKE